MRHTDQIEITLKGFGKQPHTYVVSRQLGEEMTVWLRRKLADRPQTESIPVEEAFPGLFDATEGPARALRGARYRADLTQKQLAEKTGIRQHHLSEMENGKRPIGKEMAKKLAEALACDYRLFL